jgi:hypothetical protein
MIKKDCLDNINGIELVHELRDLNDHEFQIWLHNTNKLDLIYTEEDEY